MGCGGSKEASFSESHFKKEDGTDGRLVVGAALAKPMLFKTFNGWKRFVAISKHEKEEQRKINEAIAEKARKRQEAGLDDHHESFKASRGKKKFGKSSSVNRTINRIGVGSDEAAAIREAVAKKEMTKRLQKEAAEEEKRKRMLKEPKSDSARLMAAQRKIHEMQEADRLGRNRFTSGRRKSSTGQLSFVLRDENGKPRWPTFAELREAGYMERKKLNILDIFRVRKKQDTAEAAVMAEAFAEPTGGGGTPPAAAAANGATPRRGRIGGTPRKDGASPRLTPRASPGRANTHAADGERKTRQTRMNSLTEAGNAAKKMFTRGKTKGLLGKALAHERKSKAARATHTEGTRKLSLTQAAAERATAILSASLTGGAKRKASMRGVPAPAIV